MVLLVSRQNCHVDGKAVTGSSCCGALVAANAAFPLLVRDCTMFVFVESSVTRLAEAWIVSINLFDKNHTKVEEDMTELLVCIITAVPTDKELAALPT